MPSATSCPPPSLEEGRRRVAEALAAGQTEAAWQICVALLQGGPQPELFHLMAVVRDAQGQTAQALEFFEGAAALLPGRADVAYNYGIALQRAGRLAAAILQWRRAAGLAPDHAEAWRNLGLALAETGDLAAAEAAFARLTALCPHEAAAVRLDLGNSCFQRRDFTAAAGYYRQAVALAGGEATAWCNLGETLSALGESAEAERCLRQAIALDPALDKARFNLGCLLLRQGIWREGFAGYECRGSRLKLPAPLAGLPDWRGDEAPGTRVALWNDQGFGDAIQFVRFAARLAARGQVVVVVVDPPLLRLFKTVPGLAEVVPSNGPVPPCQAQLPLSSLAGRLEIAAAADLWSGPYLGPAAPEPAARTAAPLRAGLAWAGHFPAAKTPPPEVWQPLLELPGVCWTALQPPPPPWPDRLRPYPAPSGDFADTAALMRDLDLVVTVDTATAHLAGALGKPAWLLLLKDCDWRWWDTGETTPWYPGLRLFRQPSHGDWAGAVAALAAALRDLAG